MLALLMVVGCDRDDPIVAYQAPKERVAKEQTAPRAIDWTVPEGWKPLPGDNLRYAAFTVSQDDPKVVVTVIPLPPNQPELANINRWEGQIGLPPSNETQMAKLLKRIDVNGTTAETIELTGPPVEGKPKQSILAAIFQRPDKTWYIKLQGDAEKVAAHREKFDAFVRSVKFEEPPSNADAKPGLPEGWIQQPERPMRVATYKTPGDAEVIVTRFGAQTFENKLDNINRWRNQVGLQPVTEVPEPNEKITVRGAPASLYLFDGGEKKQYVVVIERGADVWFVRFAGPAAAVDAQKKNFDSFLQTLP
jgi:hypothetical protein